jgi:hypothetical protein
MALWDIDDVVALGALPVGSADEDAEVVRARRLLDMAQALALDYLGLTEAGVVEWSESKKMRLRVWIAEKAATRITYAAAPSVDQFGTISGPLSMKLNRWEKADLREIAGQLGVATLTIDRGAYDLVGRVDRYGAPDGGAVFDDLYGV